MAQYKKIENEISLDSGNQDVVDMAKYKQHEETVRAEKSAFEQVMSQMNIADRRAFDYQFTQLWQEASDDKDLLSVLICEIDFFKEYHDNYGDQGASFMLLVVGLALKNICEKQDCFLAHYQKEEFAILIKAGDEKQVLEVAESLRQAVEASRTEHKYSKVSDIVTLSIGVSSVYPTSMQVLMRETDSALFDAKASGRNQVCGNFPQKNNRVNTGSLIGDDKQLAFTEFMQEMNLADYNAFSKSFSQLWQESAEEKELLSLFMCKLDFFDDYVDFYGKNAGEELLIMVACILLEISNKFGCLSGHVEDGKFIIVLKGGNATNALKLAEKLYNSVEEFGSEHSCSDVSNVVTVSIGLSSIFPSDVNSTKMLMAEADKALHSAIDSGRNQISVY